MKLAAALAVVTASMAFAPLPSQAVFFNEEAINYKLHIIECFGLLLSERHAMECGGKVTGPFNTITSPGSPSGPAPAPDECDLYGSLVRNLDIGERVRVAEYDPCDE